MSRDDELPSYVTSQNLVGHVRTLDHDFAPALAVAYDLPNEPLYRTREWGNPRSRAVRSGAYEYARLRHGDAWCGIRAADSTWAIYAKPSNTVAELANVEFERLSTPARATTLTSYRTAGEEVVVRPTKLWLDNNLEGTERSWRVHNRTQNQLAFHVEKLGARLFSPLTGPQFDLAWDMGGEYFVAEVKSLLSARHDAQLRLGLGQVLDYAFGLEQHVGRSVRPVLAVDQPPKHKTYWSAVCKSAHVLLTWPGFDAL